MRQKFRWRDPLRLAQLVIAVLVGLAVVRGFHVLLLAAMMSPAVSDQTVVGGLVAWENIDLTTGKFLYWIGLPLCGVWAYRVSANAHARNPRLSGGPWGMIYWYVVPFASFFMPCGVYLQVWHASHQDEAGQKKSFIVIVWWVTHVVWNLVAFGNSLVQRTEGQVGIPSIVVQEVLGTISALLYLLIVWAITRAQRETSLAEVFGEAKEGDEEELAPETVVEDPLADHIAAQLKAPTEVMKPRHMLADIPSVVQVGVPPLDRLPAKR